MQQIKLWVVSVCIAGIIGVLVRTILPKGNMEKVMLIVLRVFFLSVLLSPFLLDFNWQIDLKSDFTQKSEQYAETFQKDSDRLVKEGLQREIETMLHTGLMAKGIAPNKITVTMSAEEVAVTRVTLFLNEKDKLKEADVRYCVKQIVECPLVIQYAEKE